MSRPILLAALALSMFGCVNSSPTDPTTAPPPKSSAASAPNYSGNWSGTYAVSDCRQSQQVGLANICGAIGDSAPYSLSIVQNAQGVTVSVTLGSVQFPSTTVKVRSDGSLGWSTATTSDVFNVGAELAVIMSGNALAGTIKQFWTSWTLSGKATLTGRISTATRTTASTP
jgi:hypothetical protein